MIRYLITFSIFLFLGACGTTGLEKKAAWQDSHIFRQYNAESNSILNHSWTSKIDTSGVSFNDKHTCTLITKRHVVMAKHYTRSMKTPVIFHDRNGKRVVRKLISIKPAFGDVSVGLLDTAVPSSLRVYPMPTPMANAHRKLVNKLVIVSNQFKELHIHQVALVADSRIFFKFPEASKVGRGRKIVSGDSGNPSFIMLNGETVLIETHHTGGAGAGPFYGDIKVQTAIKQIIAATDNSYSIRTVSLQ